MNEVALLAATLASLAPGGVILALRALASEERRIRREREHPHGAAWRQA